MQLDKNGFMVWNKTENMCFQPLNVAVHSFYLFDLSIWKVMKSAQQHQATLYKEIDKSRQNLQNLINNKAQ